MKVPSRSSLDTTNVEDFLDSTPSRTQAFLMPERPAPTLDETTHAEYSSGEFGTAPALVHNNSAFTDSMGGSFNDLWPQNQSQSLTRSKSPLQPVSVMGNVTNRASLETINPIDDLRRVTNINCRKFPRSVNMNASIRASYFSFVLSQCECLSIIEIFLP